MSGRIRSIKPEAHMDEDLWDAELEFPELHLFRAFTGLWCQADREGRFEWRPRQLKPAILPHWEGDFGQVLEALRSKGFIVSYEIGGRTYGWIPTFLRHQHINGKEPISKLPPPPESLSDSGTSHATDVSGSGGSRDGDAPSLPFHLPSLPVPDPERGAGENHPDADDARETICPTDLEARCERVQIPEQFAKAYAAPIEAVRAEIRETVAYWTIGGGTGKRRRNWPKVVRSRLHELGKRGMFLAAPIATTAPPPESPEVTARRAEAQAKLEARRAEAERLGREARERAAAEGRPDPLSSARALVLAAAGADPEGVPGAAQ
jgi:hypothetical protein